MTVIQIDIALFIERKISLFFSFFFTETFVVGIYWIQINSRRNKKTL